MFRRIPFQFQEWLNVDIAGLASNSWYRPDFMVPEVKVIIQVQGTYWHSQPDRITQDSFEAALFQLAGWTVLFWWDYEIYDHLDLLFAQNPILNNAASGPPIEHTGRWYDDLKGLRTANQKRRKPWTHKPVTMKIKKPRQKAAKSYNRTRGIF